MVWGCMAHSGVGHRRLSCQCDQVCRHFSEVRGVIAHKHSSLSQHQFCFKDSGIHRLSMYTTKDNNEPRHRVRLATNWKCQNNIKALTLPAKPLDPHENLSHKVTLEIVKRHPTIKRMHGHLERWSYPRPSQCRYEADKRR